MMVRNQVVWNGKADAVIYLTQGHYEMTNVMPMHHVLSNIQLRRTFSDWANLWCLTTPSIA